jgi:hypothetical protein
VKWQSRILYNITLLFCFEGAAYMVFRASSCVSENWNKWSRRRDEVESQQNECEEPHCEDPDFNVS